MFGWVAGWMFALVAGLLLLGLVLGRYSYFAKFFE